MSEESWFSKALPWISAALTGNVPAIVGMAAKTIGDAIGEDITPTVESVSKAISGASPEQLAKIKEAENAFEIKMRDLGYTHEKELYALEVEDRNSARAREMAIRDRTPMLLSGVVTIGFFGVLFYMLLYGIPANGGEALLVMLGALGAAWTAICNYYFGSSHGSRAKDVK